MRKESAARHDHQIAWVLGPAHHTSNSRCHPSASAPLTRSIRATRLPIPLGDDPTLAPPPSQRYIRSCHGGVLPRQLCTSTVFGGLTESGGRWDDLLLREVSASVVAAVSGQHPDRHRYLRQYLPIRNSNRNTDRGHRDNRAPGSAVPPSTADPSPGRRCAPAQAVFQQPSVLGISSIGTLQALRERCRPHTTDDDRWTWSGARIDLHCHLFDRRHPVRSVE